MGLQSAGVSVPNGQVLRFSMNREETITLLKSDLNKTEWAELVNNLGISLSTPFVVKPPTEDNSRGVSLVKTESVAALASAVLDALQFGDAVLLETFIPGREIRVGVVEIDGKPQVVPATIEYIMSKEMPIRTVKDKIQTDTDGTSNMRQNKCERVIPANLESSLEKKLKEQALRAHKAVGMRDYSLFDFRVHEDTAECYIIEACSFWSYSPISVLSLMVNASQSSEQFGANRWPLTLQETVLNNWRHASLRGQR